MCINMLIFMQVKQGTRFLAYMNEEVQYDDEK